MKNRTVFIATVFVLTALSPLDLVGAIGNSLEIQGDDVYGSVGPHTTLCEFTEPSDCAEDHFDAGTSAHIGDHEYAGSDDPWAIYEVLLNQKPDCVEEDNLRFVLRYQVNDLFHGDGADADAYIKIRDWREADVTYDLLDSTVNEETSSGIQGTLDGSNVTHTQWGHGNSFFTGSTRSFSKSSISDTSETGLYLEEHGSSQSKIHVRISTNPINNLILIDHHTRIEVDWLKIQYSNETVEPTNPSNPTFHWEQSSMPGGPTTSGWYNSLDSEVEVRFSSGGSDDCQFSNIEYMWLEVDSNPPTLSSSGTLSYPDDTANSIFSRIPVPSDSGAFKFWYRAVDSLGNKAQWVSTDSIDFDFTDPQLPTIPADSSWYNQEDYIALSWLPATDTFSGMVKYNISQTGVGSIGSVDHHEDTELYTFELQTELLIPGVNQFQITAMDGTQPSPNSETKNVEIQYDPFAPIVSPPIIEGEKFTISSPDIVWTHPLAFENSIGESGVFSCQLTIDGTEVSSIPVSECTSNSGSTTLPPLGDGDHTLTISACDLALNCATGGFRNFTIDATPPSIAWYSITPSDETNWFSQNSVRVSANFSDPSVWGEGSGIDRVWHGFYEAGEIPSISELKSDYPAASICEGVCESHDFNGNFEVQDGIWVWHYVVRDKVGSESSGHSTSTTKIDTRAPHFVVGPSLDISSEGTLEANWEADDEHSGVYGYLFEVDSCDFQSLTPSTETTYSFEPVTDSHFICIQAIDAAGNKDEKIIDSADPSIECPVLSTVGGLNSQPPTVTCYLYDNSAINLHDGLGSIESILLDGYDMTSVHYLRSEEVNSFSFDVGPMEIGPHHIEINALDRYGREAQYLLDYSINGEGIKIEMQDGSYLDSEGSFNFSWDKDEWNAFFTQQLRVQGVNIDTLKREPLTEYFDVNDYDYENPLDSVITLDFKPSAIPKLGESVMLTFTIDDTYNSVEYTIQVNVENCPSTHNHNTSSDTCEPSSDLAARILALVVLAVFGGVLFRRFEEMKNDRQ